MFFLLIIKVTMNIYSKIKHLKTSLISYEIFQKFYYTFSLFSLILIRWINGNFNSKEVHTKEGKHVIKNNWAS